jgi:predicted DNA-binding transcriptional regulator AlpA
MAARVRKHRPLQLSLSLRLNVSGSGRTQTAFQSDAPNLDARMSTTEVLRLVGVHRATLYRWTRSGDFPVKHDSDGWLRSEVELWLTQRAPRLESQRPRSERYVDTPLIEVSWR